MKKRMLSGCLAAVLTLCMLLSATCFAKAESDEAVLDGSKLTLSSESVGYDTKITRGQYLLSGYSKIVVMGPGKIYAGGATIATQDVDLVKVGVIVERAQEGDTAWGFYDAWMKENNDSDRVNTSKMLEVEGGYYYRARCFHSAAGDFSSSFTDGVYVEEPSILPDLGL